jgi:hypothetical protein
MYSQDIAQRIAERDAFGLYWSIKHSQNPRRAVALALKQLKIGQVTDFTIGLVESWYNQKVQLDAAQDVLDLGDM